MPDRISKPTYERLYEMNKEKKGNELPKEKSIAQKRPTRDNKPLEQALYEDAKRREESLKRKQEEHEKTKDEPK